MNSIRHMLLGLLGCLCISLPVAASNLTLNGAARYNDLGKEKFMAALYLEQISGSYENIINATFAKRIEMRLSTSYSKRRWTNLWMQSIAISNGNKQFNAMAESLVTLFNSQKGGVQPGDIVSLNCDENNKCSYQINGVTLSSELPGDLFNLFINAWIGKAPPSASFRDAILGNSSDISIMSIDLDTIMPTTDRIAAIESWVIPPEPEIDEAELLRIAEEKAAEQKAAKDAALAKAAAEEEKAKLAAIPAQAGLFSIEEQDPAKIALAATEILKQEQREAAKAKASQELVEVATEDSENSISVESVLALQNYIRAAKKAIYKNIKYPDSALRYGYEGDVRLQLEVAQNGELISVETSQKSKYRTLNRAALKAVKKAAPYDKVPDIISDQPMSLSIPISFKLVKS